MKRKRRVREDVYSVVPVDQAVLRDLEARAAAALHINLGRAK